MTLGPTIAAPPRAFEQILGALEAEISAGALEAGDRLPAERELAARYGVSRTSVREAIRVLEAMGIVSVRRGAEHGVVLLQEPGNAFGPVLRLLVALRHVSLDDAIEFRVMVEAGAARRLAETGEGAELGEILDAMEAPGIRQADVPRARRDVPRRARPLGRQRAARPGGGGRRRPAAQDRHRRGADRLGLGRGAPAADRASTGRSSPRSCAGDGEEAAALVTQHVRHWGHRVARA